MAKKKVVKKPVKKAPIKSKKKKFDVIDFVNKKYGKGKIFKLPEKDYYDPKDFINSGSLCLNYLISGDYRCGFPRRKPIEIYGNESVGKSTLALMVAKEASRKKQMTLYCDAEKGLNEFYAKQLRINRDYFYYFLSDFGEESFEISENIILNMPIDLYIYDSIGGMRTRDVVEGGWDDKNMGSHAKLCGKAIIKLAPLFIGKNIAPVIINQLGKTIGDWGKSEDTKGGKTLKFQLWTRLEVSAPRGEKIEAKAKQKGTLDDMIDEKAIKTAKEKKAEKKKEDEKKKKEGKEVVETGTIISVRSVKNKLFMPRKKIRMQINYGRGFDKTFDFLEYLHMQKIANRNGSSKIIYNGESMMNISFVKKYKEDPEFKKEIWEKIEEHRVSIQKITEDDDFLD